MSTRAVVSDIRTSGESHALGMFSTYSYETAPVIQIETKLLLNIFKALGYRAPEGDTDTLLIIPLALSTDAVDFHLSFTASGGYTKQCHFCVRLEGRQNECLYWFYSLRETDKGILWSWDGCAGQGDATVIQKHRPKFVPFNNAPLMRFITLMNDWMGTRAELVNKPVATLNDKGKRTGTHQQRTLQTKL